MQCSAPLRARGGFSCTCTVWPACSIVPSPKCAATPVAGPDYANVPFDGLFGRLQLVRHTSTATILDLFIVMPPRLFGRLQLVRHTSTATILL